MSARDLHILICLIRGLSDQEIADHLNLTVEEIREFLVKWRYNREQA